MIALLGAIGWGLLAFGATTHIWHHGRLRQLLAMHLDREVPAALALTALEAALAVSIPVAYLSDASLLPLVAGAATAVATGFVAWIALLLRSGSELPCACSFADTPTSRWSLARALVTALVAGFVFAEPSADDVATSVATLAVGLAIAGAVFVLPESVVWPPTSRALLGRIDAHGPSTPR